MNSIYARVLSAMIPERALRHKVRSILLGGDIQGVEAPCEGVEAPCEDIEASCEDVVFPSDFFISPPKAWFFASNAALDLNNACNLRCGFCYRGTGQIPNTNDVMSIDLFMTICQKMLSEKITILDIFNWCEPFLTPQLPEYIEIATSMGFKTRISSNLAIQKEIPLLDVFRRGEERVELIISISGMTNDIHNIYHVGSDIELVKKDAFRLVKILRMQKKQRLNFLISDTIPISMPKRSILHTHWECKWNMSL